jgi:hypothetical protein
MPPTSLSQTPFFQHLLSSLPSLRGQIKDAVTASMKQWLLEIRNISAQVGKLALDAMELRTKRWKSRREKDPLLRMSRVGSAVEMVTYEKTECKLLKGCLCNLIIYMSSYQSTCLTMTAFMLISSPSLNASISTQPWTLSTNCRNPIKQTERSAISFRKYSQHFEMLSYRHNLTLYYRILFHFHPLTQSPKKYLVSSSSRPTYSRQRAISDLNETLKNFGMFLLHVSQWPWKMRF